MQSQMRAVYHIITQYSVQQDRTPRVILRSGK